jgi:hypothetical protein
LPSYRCNSRVQQKIASSCFSPRNSPSPSSSFRQLPTFNFYSLLLAFPPVLFARLSSLFHASCAVVKTQYLVHFIAHVHVGQWYLSVRRLNDAVSVGACAATAPANGGRSRKAMVMVFFQVRHRDVLFKAIFRMVTVNFQLLSLGALAAAVSFLRTNFLGDYTRGCASGLPASVAPEAGGKLPSPNSYLILALKTRFPSTAPSSRPPSPTPCTCPRSCIFCTALPGYQPTRRAFRAPRASCTVP